MLDFAYESYKCQLAMILQDKVLAALLPSTGISARELAKALNEEKSEVNSCLYKLQADGKVHVDENYRWYAGKNNGSGAGLDNSCSTFLNLQPAVATTSSEFKPTAEQTPVIETPVDGRLFVEAGPGTGKTEVLVARLKYLLDSCGLAPAEVLVLSFSVAAVKELRTRIERLCAEQGANLAFVDIRTFDSFASRFLRSCISLNELQELDYDERILRATKEIATNKATAENLKSYRHVLLDEMQDLVGVRADFALVLLSAAQPGFTLFGDSAQGIYDFTIQEGPSKTSSVDLLVGIKKKFPELNDKSRFTKNFRVGGDVHLEHIARQGRTLLLESPEKARAFLESEFKTLSGQGSTGNPDIDSEFLHEATCVVCRTNGQVLRLAGQLHEKNIPFQIARDKNEFLAPAWLGHVFIGWPKPNVNEQDFVSIVKEKLNLPELETLQLWRDFIASFLPPKKNSFNADNLRAALTDGILVPDHPLFPRNTNVIQLSTIHRSKGREFGNVIVVMRADDDKAPAKKEDRTYDDTEPKVLFVALTRAKKTLHRMEAKAKNIWMPKERWIRSFPQGSHTVFSGIQVGLANDVDINSFALGEPDDVLENQKFLLENARPGKAVELWFDGREDGCPRYKIMIDKFCVGRMSSNFGWAVWHTLKDLNGRKPHLFPKRITHIWVKEISTAVGNTGCEDIDLCFRFSGLWMTLTLEGLGNCEW